MVKVYRPLPVWRSAVASLLDGSDVRVLGAARARNVRSAMAATSRVDSLPKKPPRQSKRHRQLTSGFG